MKGLGSGIKEFKNATKEEEEKPKVEEEKKAQFNCLNELKIVFNSNIYSRLFAEGAKAKPSTTIHLL